MAITYTQTGTFVFAEGGGITSVLSPTASSALLVGLGGAYNPGPMGPTAVTDNQSNSWTRAGEIGIGSDPIYVASYYALGAAAGVTGVTLTPSSGTFPAFVASELAVPAGTVANAPATASGFSTTLSIAGVTPSTADNVGLLSCAWYGFYDLPTPSGWTLIGKKIDFNSSTTLAAYYRIQTAQTEYSATIALDASRDWVAVLMAFSAPDGAPSDTPMARESGLRRRVFGRIWGRVN